MPALSVKLRDGLIWARFDDTPLEDAIHAIGERARFQVEIRGELSEAVSVSLKGVSIVEGVRALLGQHSWVAVYEATGRVGQLYVYGRNDADADGGAWPRPRAVSAEANPPGTKRSFDDGRSRLETIKELASERPEGAFEALASALIEDDDPVVRWNAAAALSNFPADSAAIALSSVLEDSSEEPDIRRIAAWALGKLDDETARRALREATLDPEPDVRKAARDALKPKMRSRDRALRPRSIDQRTR